MPDGQYSPTSKSGKLGIDLGILGKEVDSGLGLSEEDQEHLQEQFEEISERERLMSKNILLNEADLTKKIGVVRGDRVDVGLWNRFAAMYTIGSSDGSCSITFETREKDSNAIVAYTIERMRIDSTGNVGIGTTSPSAKLEVSGNVKVTGDIFLTGGADCAEEFDIVSAESIEPGTVMVIDNDGALRASEKPYDRRVAGVISGAGDYHPGITLDRQKERANRLPLALTGKVYCKVNAEYSSINIGDLLTTSPTIGHAMKVSDHSKSLGAIIGKALRPLKTGRGMIPILVALQ